MGTKLWFLTNGVKVIAVFDNKSDARQELAKYQDDPDYSYYDIYFVNIDDLEDYPDEYDIALEEGFLD